MNNLIAIILGILLAFVYVEKSKKQAKPPQWDNVPEMNDKPKSETPPSQDKIPQSYADALQVAREKQKMLFLFFEADWCSWCGKMKNETLSDPKVIQELNKYVFYKVDVDKESDVTKKYNVTSIPVSVVADTKEQTVKSATGYMSTSDFLKWIKDENKPKLFGKKSKFWR